MLQKFNKEQICYVGTLTGLKAKIISENINDACYSSIMAHSWIDIGNINTYFNSKRPLQWVKYYDNFNNDYIYIAFPLNDNKLEYKCNRGYHISVPFQNTIEL